MGLLRRARPTPVTLAFLVVLLATTLLQRDSSPDQVEQWLTASSTDVAHLGRDPIAVLLASAIWLPGLLWLPYAVVLGVAGTALERRTGALRTAVVFLSGHVLATLLTELPIAAAIAAGRLGSDSAHRIDVGASYGTLAVVAAYVGSLSRPRAVLTLLVAVPLTIGIPASLLDMTTIGHALSLAIGFCWWPVLYDAGSPNPGEPVLRGESMRVRRSGG